VGTHLLCDAWGLQQLLIENLSIRILLIVDNSIVIYYPRREVVDGYPQCINIIPIPNGGTQGVPQNFLKDHGDLNVRIRPLKVLPGATKNPPDFMTLMNHTTPRTPEQRPTIVDSLTRTYTHLPLCHGHTLFIVTDTHQHIDRGLYTYMTSYLAQVYRLSILIDKPTLFINNLLIRL
jgi:hypothetical protein